MNLKEFRKSQKITQVEAAKAIGIPYRTYVRYEEEPQYQNSYKYKKILEDLEKHFEITEEKGVLTIDEIKDKLIPVLKNRNITYCYLFGSYAEGSAKENSDIDLLVDTNITGFEFFGLIEEIRETLHKKIDLLRLDDIKADNPIALEILKKGIRIL